MEFWQWIYGKYALKFVYGPLKIDTMRRPYYNNYMKVIILIVRNGYVAINSSYRVDFKLVLFDVYPLRRDGFLSDDLPGILGFPSTFHNQLHFQICSRNRHSV